MLFDVGDLILAGALLLWGGLLVGFVVGTLIEHHRARDPRHYQ